MDGAVSRFGARSSVMIKGCILDEVDSNKCADNI